MQAKPRVFFRADGSSIIGLGHVIRSLALAEMIKDTFDCHFIIREPLQSLVEQINEICKSIHHLENKDDYIAEATYWSQKYLKKEDIVVLDGYAFNTEYQKVIKKTGCFLICIDDIHEYHFVADIVINHALGAQATSYSASNKTKHLLGYKYCLLRSPFLMSELKNKSNNKKEILICFGGSDQFNLTSKIVKAVHNAGLNNSPINIIIGIANNNKSKIIQILKRLEFKTAKIYENISANEMQVIMTRCRLAIIPASTISMECLSQHLNLVCGYYVDNQVEYYSKLVEYGYITPVDNYLTTSQPFLSKSIKESYETEVFQNEIIDSKIPERFIKEFKPDRTT